MADGQARESERLQEEGRAGGGGESLKYLAVRAGEAGEGLARGEARGDGVADVNNTEAGGLAIGQDALVYTAGVPELEADGTGERRARREQQQRAELRGERDRAVGDGVDVADAALGSEDDRVRFVRTVVIGTGGVERGGDGTIHREIEGAGELGEGSRGDFRADDRARPGGLGNQHVVAVGIEGRQEGDMHASERVVHDERGRFWLEEMRREEGANAGPIGVGRGVERAVAADEVVAEGELGMPRDRIADDENVAGDDKIARAEGTDNPPAGFRAGAHEDAGVGCGGH